MSSDWYLFFGHFHPVLVHLPIGMLMLAGLMYFFSKTEDVQAKQKTFAPFFFWAGITAIFSCAMGYALSLSGEYDEETLFLHQYLGISVAVVSLVLAYMSWSWSKDAVMRKLFVPTLSLCLLLLTITGHLGGNLTHGSDYLTQYLPSPYRDWVGLPEKQNSTGETGAVIKIANINEALVYQDLVQPLLKQKCWACHNAEKQKGKLRMDQTSFLMKGGENGQIILAGDPDKSEMIKRLLLPESDEHHMPPKGKPGMTEDETALLHWWIKSGADFKSKVKALSSDAKIKKILAKYSSGEGPEGPYLSPVFKDDISEADAADIQTLMNLKLLVLPMAKDQAFLEVNAINARKITDKDLQEISSIQEQLVSLKLANTQVTDEFVMDLADYPRLINLQLGHTKITDKSLEALQNSPRLETLNIYATAVTDAGILKLAKIKTLRNLYVWQSKVSPAGIAQLKKLRPKLHIDNGTKVVFPIKQDSLIL
jgi:uncharacterized membrane protein